MNFEKGKVKINVSLYTLRRHVGRDEKHLYSLTIRRLMSYIYGAPILDVSRSHTTTQHSR